MKRKIQNNRIPQEYMAQNRKVIREFNFKGEITILFDKNLDFIEFYLTLTMLIYLRFLSWIF